MKSALVLVIFAVFLDIAELKVLVQPIGRVAYPGTTVHYSCEGTTTSSTTLNVNDKLVVGGTFPNHAAVQTYQNRQFSWTRTPSQGGTTVRWDLTVLANAENNNTRIKCNFDSAITKEVVLVVVDGPPGPPAAPTVQPSNLTALTLTWTAPWPHPVTNYTVTMLNLTTNQITQWTATEKRYVLTSEQESSQCDELVFTVEAETDVGSTGPSTNTTGGFPRPITPVNKEELDLQMKTLVQDRTAILNVEFQPPAVCYHQNLTYNYTIIDLDRAAIVLSETSSLTNVTLSGGILFNVQYTLQLTVQNSDWESESLVYNFTIAGDCQLQVTESALPENCPLLSSSAATSFNAFFNQSSCALFGELDFTDSTSNNSWDAIADTCITEYLILQRLLLRQQSHDTQPHPLIDGRCQSYTFFNDENMCQYRMDCLLRFLTNTTSDQYGYIHLRNISSDQLLFEAAITDLFNTSQNPLFTFSNTSKDCPKVPLPSSTTPSSASPPSVTILPILVTTVPLPSSTTPSSAYPPSETILPILVTTAVFIVIAILVFIVLLVVMYHRMHRQRTLQHVYDYVEPSIPPQLPPPRLTTHDNPAYEKFELNNCLAYQVD